MSRIPSDMSHATGQDSGGFTGINVTPLTDVMLVLLITFLLSASTFESDTLSIPLPQIKESRDLQKHAVVLQVSREGVPLWPKAEWKELEPEEALTRLLQENFDNPTLAIAVDRDCPYSKFYPLAAKASEAGWQRLLLLTEESASD